MALHRELLKQSIFRTTQAFASPISIIVPGVTPDSSAGPSQQLLIGPVVEVYFNFARPLALIS